MTLVQIRRVLIGGCVVLVGLLAGLSILSTVAHEHAQTANVPAPLAVGDAVQHPRPTPQVRLLNADGKAVSLHSFRGRWIVLAPSMTLCQEVCPMTTGVLNELESGLRRAGLATKVVVAEVTVDPWRDRPWRLRAYAKLAGVHFEQLTGTPSNIHLLWKFFGVYYHRVAEGRPPATDWLTHKPLSFDIAHTDAVFILDPAGRLRILDDGMPQLSGPLPTRLQSLLDAQGRANLAHPALPWNASEIIDDLAFLMNREIPASELAPVNPPSPVRAREQLAGSPTALATLHTQAGQLLAGTSALASRLAALHGHPVVVNVWSSSCGPCRGEFPLLATASARYGRRVAFLGIDVNDTSSSARAFLAAHPVSYPSYTDRSGNLGSLTDGEYTPTTIFISRAGKVLDRHIGEYDTLPALENDIEHYSLGIRG